MSWTATLQIGKGTRRVVTCDNFQQAKQAIERQLGHDESLVIDFEMDTLVAYRIIYPALGTIGTVEIALD